MDSFLKDFDRKLITKDTMFDIVDEMIKYTCKRKPWQPSDKQAVISALNQLIVSRPASDRQFMHDANKHLIPQIVDLLVRAEQVQVRQKQQQQQQDEPIEF